MKTAMFTTRMANITTGLLLRTGSSLRGITLQAQFECSSQPDTSRPMGQRLTPPLPQRSQTLWCREHLPPCGGTEARAGHADPAGLLQLVDAGSSIEPAQERRCVSRDHWIAVGVPPTHCHTRVVWLHQPRAILHVRGSNHPMAIARRAGLVERFHIAFENSREEVCRYSGIDLLFPPQRSM